PNRPHYQWAEDATWTLWELQPELHDDYFEQQDLFVGKSMNPPMWQAAHSGTMFCSERFSRPGEMFCFLKVDGTEDLSGMRFADKSEMEDALDTVLKPADLGCCVGGGMGHRYAYIDLALLDAERGIQVLRERLRAGKVPKRSWIQFFDSELAAEWVGIFDD